ncbi:MAG: Crp/Fnr family transcriptional regulator [Elusimicrobia bacterium]|nr:Crp/Fnr family transcriptional regulator [Elusimicrobiota bacterium]
MLALLRRCPIFRGVPEKKLKKVLAFSRTADFRAGTPIFNQRDLANQMFIVASGRVRIFVSSASKKRKTFAYMGEGAFFGEMALLDSKVRSASAEAVEDCRVVIIHKKDFKRVLLKDPNLCFQILRTLCERLRNMDEQIENLLFRNILGRVTKTLCDLGRQNGQRKGVSVLLKDPLSRQELADLVGTTREPLSRALGSLRRAQLIAFQGEHILLRDMPRMESLIGAAVPAAE